MIILERLSEKFSNRHSESISESYYLLFRIKKNLKQVQVDVTRACQTTSFCFKGIEFSSSRIFYCL